MISPLDSRYKDKVKTITDLFSDEELILQKFNIEISYTFNLLVEIGYMKREDCNEFLSKVNEQETFEMKKYAITSSTKKHESVVGHDIKAIEITISQLIDKNREYFDDLGYDIEVIKNHIHFGLTSQDIVSLATVSQITKAAQELFQLHEMCTLHITTKFDNQSIVVARTHGQPALLSTLKKHMNRYYVRLTQKHISGYVLSCKFGGAIGEPLPLQLCYPNIHWDLFLMNFTEKVSIKKTHTTTQTDNWDSVCDLFDEYSKMCSIYINLCQDIWDYISRNYVKIKISKDYVGSSTMAQKINPIKFENAEGNFQLAQSQFDFFSKKLRISRLHRDLSDSTVIRSIGIPIAHYYLAIKTLIEAFESIEYSNQNLSFDTDNYYHTLAEAVQHIFRKSNIENPYTVVREYFQGYSYMTKMQYIAFIEKFEGKLNKQDYNILLNLTPITYAVYS